MRWRSPSRAFSTKSASSSASSGVTLTNLPRQEIKEDELIVNVAHAKKTGQDVVRHLASHAGMVENYDEETGSVRPSRVMQPESSFP